MVKNGLLPASCFRLRSFVRSFVIAGRGYVGPMRQPRERRGIGRCVRCMCELCRVEEGLSRREQLVRYF